MTSVDFNRPYLLHSLKVVWFDNDITKVNFFIKSKKIKDFTLHIVCRKLMLLYSKLL